MHGDLTPPGQPVVGPVEVADHVDPVAYSEYSTVLARDVAANVTAKGDAGARLFFALYHHPRAADLFKSDFMSTGLMRAYTNAHRVFLPPDPSTDGGGVPTAPVSGAVAAARGRP